MILAIDCREFVPGRMTGIGRFLRILLEEVAHNHPHLTTVGIVRPDGALPVHASHLRSHRLPGGPSLYTDQILFPRLLREMGASAFFSPYYKAPLAACCPCVVTIHDLIPIRFPGYLQGAGRVYAAAFRRWASLHAHRAAGIVTDSEHSKRDIIDALRIPESRVHVIPVGVSDEFRPDLPSDTTRAVAARYGISGRYLLAVGNFLPHKNLGRLVEAFDALPQAVRADTTLVLAGTPGGHGPARPMDPGRFVRPGVNLPGFIAPEDLPRVYAGAVALVCPSLTEGFGLPVLEAMACGTPVVCARAGALPEVAGEAALYVDPTDVAGIVAGIARILTDAPLRREMSARGIARARLFAPQKTTARLVGLLEQIAGTQGGA